MWEMLDSRAVDFRENLHTGGVLDSGNPPAASLSSGAAPANDMAASSWTASLRIELRGNALRQALSMATRGCDLNVVSYPGQTAAENRRVLLEEEAVSYVQNHLQVL
eukprot:6214774-Pleurochrysis_carterae.AAC.10